ncbi:MAG: APC family permease [Gemmatimonadota bacterium]
MTSAVETSEPLPLVRGLKLRDMVLFNMVAVLSLRWLATSAAAGPSAITLWLLAALFFFVPQGLAVGDLSARYPEEGGIYAWTKHAYGEGHGFLCGWCYWVNNLLYYPNLLISTAVISTYVFGRGGTGLENNWTYILSATLVLLWIATALNIVGVSTGKWLQNVGAICSYLPGVALVGFGVYAMFTRPAANTFDLHSLTPDFGDLSALNLWASIAFAFAGLELAATMAAEVDQPRRTLPRAVLIAAPLIALLYVLGTVMVLWLIPTKSINIVSGFLQATSVGASHFGGGLLWVVPVAAGLYVIGNLGGVGAWLCGPARVAFVIGLDRYFPPAFGKIHPRWKTPYVAILVQSILATLFLFLSVLGQGTTVAKAYLILLDTMLLVYFIPYIYLFLTHIRLTGKDGGRPGRWYTKLVSLIGLGLTLFAMIVACVPPGGSEGALVFELKVVGGALAFVVLGGIIYWRGQRRSVA